MTAQLTFKRDSGGGHPEEPSRAQFRQDGKYGLLDRPALSLVDFDFDAFEHGEQRGTSRSQQIINFWQVPQLHDSEIGHPLVSDHSNCQDPYGTRGRT